MGEWYERSPGDHAARFYSVRLQIAIKLVESGHGARVPGRLADWLRPVPLQGVPPTALLAIHGATTAAQEHLAQGDSRAAVEAIRRALAWTGQRVTAELASGR